MRFLVVAAALALFAGAGVAAADPPRPPSLKTVAVPGPSNLDDFVRDRETLVVLGKALFWDMQLGSDGVTACTTCHFNAGADSRSRNQLNPGVRRVTSDGVPDPDPIFGAGRGPNHQLAVTAFPLSPLTNDVVGSQGIAHAFGGWTAVPPPADRGDPAERHAPRVLLSQAPGLTLDAARHAGHAGELVQPNGRKV